jgi:hypothetical protein
LTEYRTLIEQVKVDRLKISGVVLMMWKCGAFCRRSLKSESHIDAIAMDSFSQDTVNGATRIDN